MKTIEQYRKDALDYKSIPHKLYELGVEASADYALLSEQYGILEVAKAKFWEDKELSDTKIEMMWLRTEDEANMNTIKRHMKGLEMLKSSIRGLIYNANQEKFN